MLSQVIPVIGIASHLLIIHVGYEKYFEPLTSHGPFSLGKGGDEHTDAGLLTDEESIRR